MADFSVVVDQNALLAEVTVQRNVATRKSSSDFAAYRAILLDDVTPNLCALTRISLTLPVSSAACERSFSLTKIQSTLDLTYFHLT